MEMQEKVLIWILRSKNQEPADIKQRFVQKVEEDQQKRMEQLFKKIEALEKITLVLGLFSKLK
jgi:hypothetical protein